MVTTLVKKHSQPIISVVIITFNRCQDLERCLRSLIKQTLKNFEIIVIDNGSTDNTKAILYKYDARVHEVPRHNKAYLRNIGLKLAKAPIIAFIDDDAEASHEWLEHLVHTYCLNGRIGAVGGPAIVKTSRQKIIGFIRSSRNSKVFSWILRAYETAIAGTSLSEVGVFTPSGVYSIGGSMVESLTLPGPVDVDILSTCNASVRGDVAQIVGGFDENFVFNHEDGDFFIRIKRNKFRIMFTPAGSVVHHVNPTRSTRASYRLMGRDFGYFYAKNINPPNISWMIRSVLNLLVFNLFWVIETLRIQNPSCLEALTGFIEGWLLSRNKRRIHLS